MNDALTFLEHHAVFTREGTDGVRQVETRGLVAAAFTHRDSRAGDPDLHTHVAIANKVQTRDGKWLSVYGTVLHQYVVATSEAYNTALEHRLNEVLGVRFADTRRSAWQARGPRDRRRRSSALRTVVQPTQRHRGPAGRARCGVHHASTADAPTAKESIALAQRANLETRAAKHEPRSEAEQRAPGTGKRRRSWEARASIA